MKKKFKVLAPFIVLVLGLIATMMVFLPAIKYPDSETFFTGIEVIKGVTIIDLGAVISGKMPFGVLALLAFTLPLFAGMVSLLKPRSFFPILLFIGGAVLIFLISTYTMINVTSWIGDTEVDIKWILLTGPIVAGSLSIAGAAISGASFLSSK